VPPSVGTVTELAGLGLSLVAGADGRQRPVQWVAVSELEDPTPFLEGGELLLTTGMRLPDDDPVALEYVARLVRADVAALGLGIGLTHAEVPASLAAAAQAAGLPLIEVPSGTAFISISKAVGSLLAAEEHEGITRAFEAQRDLTRAAIATDGTAAVAARLARHVQGWVLVLDSSGGAVAAVTSPAYAGSVDLAGWPTAHRADLADLRRRGLLASSALADADGAVSVHPLGVRGRVRGFLAVGTRGSLDRNRQSLVAVAVSLLSIAMEQDEPGVLGGGQVRAATMRLLFAGAPATELPLALLGWDWVVDSPLRVLVARGTSAERAEIGHLLQPEHAEAGIVVVDTATELVALLEDPGGAWEPGRPALGPFTAGGSRTVTVAELARGRTEALQALAAAHGPGTHWFGQLAASGMLGALDPEAARGVADALLAPLEGRRADLLASLAAWLARHGQWDTAAADLGVHRHTLRYRMRRVEELLGRSLDDADLRAELWLALRVRGARGPGR
jgi:purine catabolism regulator